MDAADFPQKGLNVRVDNVINFRHNQKRLALLVLRNDGSADDFPDPTKRWCGIVTDKSYEESTGPDGVDLIWSSGMHSTSTGVVREWVDGFLGTCNKP